MGHIKQAISSHKTMNEQALLEEFVHHLIVFELSIADYDVQIDFSMLRMHQTM